MFQRSRLATLSGIALSAFASAVCAQTPDKQKAAPITSQSPDFLLQVNQPYCDFSLPYTFTDVGGAGGKTPLPSVTMQVRNASWLNTFQTQEAGLPGTSKDHLAFEIGSGLQAKYSDSAFADTGGALLASAGKEFSRDGHEMKNLLVRTLFGPNAFANACNPDYITKDALPKSNKTVLLTQPDQPPYSFGRLGDNQAPEYYLIDIVRWIRSKDGSYQVGSDEWYVYNYGDAQDFKREVPGLLGKRFHPMVQDDLRLIGSKRIMFLAIHLAPSYFAKAPASAASTGDAAFTGAGWLGAPPQVVSSLALAATDPQWYEATISYKIHADKLEPANFQDFDLLFQIVTGLPALGKAPVAVAGGVGPSFALTKDEIAMAHAAQLIVELEEAEAEQPLLHYQVQDAIAALNDVIAHPTTASQAIDAAEAIAQAAKVIPSFYQGRYAAGMLTNLASLPVTLTSTWTRSANKSRMPAPKQDAGAVSPLPAYGTIVAGTGSRSAANASVVTNTCSTSKGTDGGVAPCTGTQVFQNEGLYTWDFSVGVPFTGLNQIQLSSDGTVATKKTITRVNAFAFFEFMPWKEDIVSPPRLGIPHPMVGLPIAGKVFNTPFFGLGESFNLKKMHLGVISSAIPVSIRFYGGVNYTKNFLSRYPVGSSATPAQVAASLYPERVLKGQFGIELSLRDVGKSLLKKTASK